MTDKEKFTEDCYRQYDEFLRNVCRQKVNGDPLYRDVINNCLQDTFLLAYQSYDSLVDHSNIRAWLTRACLNRLLPYVELQRKRMKHEAYSLDDPQRTAGAKLFDRRASEYPAKKEAAEWISELLAQLSEQERSIFHLYFLEELSLADIAAIRHCSVGTVKGIIHRIRKKARKMKDYFLTM